MLGVLALLRKLLLLLLLILKELKDGDAGCVDSELLLVADGVVGDAVEAAAVVCCLNNEMFFILFNSDGFRRNLMIKILLITQ